MTPVAPFFGDEVRGPLTYRGGPLKRVDDYPALLESCWWEHLELKPEGAPTVASLFAGAGGSSLGYSMAGFREVLAVEWDAMAAGTLKANFPGVSVHVGDVADLFVGDCAEMAGIGEGGLDVLDGSPPCQGFSTSGKRQIDDSRNRLFMEFARLLRGLRPRAFVMENVSGMAKGGMKSLAAECMRELRSCGYRVAVELMNAKHHGVPQSRERCIFIGVRDDLGVPPSHPPGWSLPIPMKNALLGADVSGLPKFDDVYAALWNRVPKGGSAQRVIGKGFNNCVRPDENRPCPTLPKTQTGRGFATVAHPTEKRALSVGEAKRLTSFPDGFKLSGEKYETQWAQIGNSVPPLMMRSIAKHIKNILERIR